MKVEEDEILPYHICSRDKVITKVHELTPNSLQLILNRNYTISMSCFI